MWQKTPEKIDDKEIVWLLRARAGKPVTADLDGDPLRCFIHYVMGRSWPCTDWHCCLCARGIGRRLYAYYPVTGRNGSVGILELTAQAEAAMIKQMGPHTDTPIGQVVVTRPPGRRNLPCVVTWSPSENNKKRTSYPMDQTELANTLMRIWKLPSRNGQIEEKEYLERLNEAIRLRTTKPN